MGKDLKALAGTDAPTDVIEKEQATARTTMDALEFNPVRSLIAIFNGQTPQAVTLQQQIDIAKSLLPYFSPALKSVDTTVQHKGNIIIEVNRFGAPPMTIPNNPTSKPALDVSSKPTVLSFDLPHVTENIPNNLRIADTPDKLKAYEEGL